MRKKLSFLLMAILSAINLWAQDSAYDKLVIQDGVCQITTAEELQNYASAVNTGNKDLPAVLTSDIDLTDVSFPGIGTDENPFMATFDGRYHTITLNQTATKQCYSLFYNVTNGTIKNLRTAGTITTAYRLTSGFCGNLNGSTIENCISSVEIISSFNGDAAQAGFCGFTNVANGVYSSLKNCTFNGKISGETSLNCAGLVNWCFDKTYFENCLQIGSVETPDGGDACTIARTNKSICNNVYYLNSWGTPQAGSSQITENQLASGETCYLLNGEQKEFQWTQNLEQDFCPTPWPTQKNVYINGQVDCIGRIIEGTEYSFSNSGSVSIPDHNFKDGICSVCKRIDESFCKTEDGYYLVATPAELVWLSKKVASGENVINVKLVSDIDLSNVEFPAIGTVDFPFKGTFDGQYHTVTLNQVANMQEYSLFYHVMNGSIKNLRTAGTITTAYRLTSGFCGNLNGSTIENCISSVEIISSFDGDAAHAGFCGFTNIANDIVSTLKNCVFNGKISGETSQNSAGLVNWCYNKTQFENCLQIGEISTMAGNDACTIARTGNVECSNVYFKDISGKIQSGTIQISEDQLKSGEVCYLLNGNQSDLQWTQTLGENNEPSPWSTGKIVYIDGQTDCIGRIIEDTPYSFSNNGTINLPPHNYVNGSCSVCGQVDSSISVELVDGFYQISTIDHLNWFANEVNKGNNAINGKLLADIDLTGTNYPMIGTTTVHYAGTFDGQNHTIILNQTAHQDFYSVFCVIENATIKNLRTSGDINTAYRLAAGISAQTISSTIQNCVSSVNIISSYYGDAAHAGITGWAINNCVIKDCMFNGSISGDATINCAGLCGWSEGGIYFKNCLVVADISIQGDTWNISRNPGQIGCQNTYYLNTTVNTNDGSIKVTSDQLENGEVCYRLNRDQSDRQWTQTIGGEVLPLPDPSGKPVFMFGDVVMNVETNDDFIMFKEAICSTEYSYCDKVIANKEKISQYESVIDQINECNSIEELVALQNSFALYKLPVQKSEEAYREFLGKVEDTKAYLDANSDMEGEPFDVLMNYLNEYEEPSDVYVNGSVPYIVDVLVLDKEDLLQEIKWIDNMLNRLVITCPTVGTDVTMLLTNADFSDGFKGWSGALATGYGTSETSPVRAAECWNRTMDMYQTVTGIKNGIYELRINGAFCPSPTQDSYNTNYAAMFYANDIHNYFQANIEDMISESDAIDGQNCYLAGDRAIEDIDGNTIGYTLNGLVSCCNAFQAGRYQNSVLVNVTDGQLTIGIKQPGTGHQPEWLGFGNIQLTYCGTLEESDENLNQVLMSQSQRASVILNDYEYSLGDDYSYYPNFSQELKDELKACLSAADNTSDVAEKYALVEKFSDLFQKIYDSKKDYIVLMKQYYALEDMSAFLLPFLDNDELNELDGLLETLASAYNDGSFSKEECTKNYINGLSFLPNGDKDFAIGNVKDLLVFAIYTNNIDSSCDAVLTADIDLSEVDYPMIGTTTTHYSGTFDGQYHTVTFNQMAHQSYYGLFCIAENATIKNLHTAGNITTDYNLCGGIAGQLISCTIQNCVSSVNIISNFNGDAAHGGFTGWARLCTFNNCLFNGSITGETTQNCAGFSGWCDGATFYSNCLQLGEINISSNQGDTYNISRQPYDVSCKNVFYLYPVKNINYGSTLITQEQLENGEICFLLNGNQTDIQWTQTIGVDAYPVPFPTQKQVYAEGELSCDAQILGDVTFTNTNTPLPAHEFVNGICINCGTSDPDFHIDVVDGIYQISNVEQFLWFTAKVNNGENNLNAQLTDDIDLSHSAFPMIGTDVYHYQGVFDGQNHTVTIDITAKNPITGLFYVISGGTVKNLKVNGNIKTAYNIAAGITGELFGGTIQNCISSVTINSSLWGDAAHAGIVSVTDDYQGKHSSIIDCLFNGSIMGETTNNCAGIVGWCSNTTYITNCLQIGEILCLTSQGNIIARNGGNAVISNVYFKNYQGNANDNAIHIDDEQLASGEVCYLLNDNREDIQWTQKLGEDIHPIPFLTREGVTQDSNGNYVNFDLTPVSDVIEEKLPGLSSGIYNLMGQKVAKAKKGVYIINGKKVFVND